MVQKLSEAMLADLKAARRQKLAARVATAITWVLLLAGFVACEYVEAGREVDCRARECVWIDGCSHNRCVCR
jgi:hypothetical protein